MNADLRRMLVDIQKTQGQILRRLDAMTSPAERDRSMNYENVVPMSRGRADELGIDLPDLDIPEDSPTSLAELRASMKRHPSTSETVA